LVGLILSGGPTVGTYTQSEMKPLHLIYVAGLMIGMMGTSTPSQAVDVQKDDFYQFARKSAELYRGQLFTKTEMGKFVNELARLTGSDSAESAPLLASLKANPYDVKLIATAVQWLDTECHSKGCLDRAVGAQLKILKVRLAVHYEMLTQVAETYEG
jgi:hypothetical protein